MRALTVAEAIGEGIISVPETLLDGLKRTKQGLEFWNIEQEVKIGGQNERAYKALKALYKYGIADYNSPIQKAIRIILVNFFEALPDAEKKKVIDAIFKKGVYFGAKFAASIGLSMYVSGEIVERVAKNAVAQQLCKYLGSAELTLLSLQGVLYKAGAASERLEKKFPKIYWELRRKNLDMIYFLIEKPMAKYLEVIRLSRMKSPIKLSNGIL
jgi:hypothetical protein